MKRKKILAACLALLMLLPLAPMAFAAELPFDASWFQGISLKNLIQDGQGHIDLAGGSFMLENILFLEENVVDEELELCICEVSDQFQSAGQLVPDPSMLPPGCTVELRKEKVRIPDAKDGTEVAEELRLEKAGRQPEETEKEVSPADRDREATYLYLTGRPEKVGNFIFVLFDGKLRLVEVEVLKEKPEEPAAVEVPAEQEPVQTEEPVITETWVDPFAPATPEEPPVPTQAPVPAFVLPAPSVTVTGAAAVRQGESVILTAEITDAYNPSCQWYVWDGQNWQMLPGETATQYRPDTGAAGDRIYLCEVTNSAEGQSATAYSEPVTVTVEAQPAQPQLPTPTVMGVTGSTRVEQGETAVLEVQAANTYNASYQWYEGQTPIEDGTGNSPQYRPDTSEAGTQVYTVLVVNNGNTGETTYAFSDPVTFTVEERPSLPTPTVSISGSSNVTVGDSAVLEAKVQDGYNLSYQWFTSLGYYDAPIQSSDAASSRFRPDTSQAGTWTYFCRVTSSGYGQEVTVDSDPVTFTVAERQVRRIVGVTVDTMPNKITYTDGERLDTTGLVLLVQYNDGTYERVTSGFTAEPAAVSFGRNGSAEATIHYQGFDVSIALTVKQQAKQIRTVKIDTLPQKTTYTDGEYLDTKGLVLLVQYTDGTYERVSSGFTAAPTLIRYNNTSTANIAVRYQGYTLTYQINVRSQQQSMAEKVRGIGVLNMPNKTSYTVGENLDTTGLRIRVYSYDGQYLDIGEGFECSPTRFNGTGNQTVTVSFLGKTCTFTVAVSEARRVYGLTIQSLPANRSYAVGDTISTAGLVLQLQTNSGYETVTSGFSISPRVASSVGTQMVTVSYAGLTANYNIEVHQSNIPRATPAPTPYPYTNPTPYPYTSPTPYPVGGASPNPFASPSPAPSGFPTPTPLPGVSASPAPSATPRPVVTPAPTRRNTGVGTMVKVLFGVAVLALGGLIGYMLYLRKHDLGEEDILREEKPSEKMHDFFSKFKKNGKDQ